MSAETAVVVAETHGAHVFEAHGGWNRKTVLTPDDAGDFGGHNVSAALVGDEAIVGGPSAGSEGGAVYLFERVDGQWRQRHQFVPDGGRGEFGRAVGFDGDRAVVGDVSDPTPERSWIGRAYVFRRHDTNWTQEATLGTDAQNLFGTSVAVDGDTVLIGAPYAEPDGERIGAVYGYELTDGEWQRRTTFTADDAVTDSLFGQSVAIDGDTAAVGAPGGGGGSAYVFERTADEWTRQARITAPDGDSEDDFGQSVALTGGIAVVGAPGAARIGHAYVFRAADDWTETRRLVAADPNEDSEFGFAVALFDDTVLVGSPRFREASPAYLFDL